MSPRQAARYERRKPWLEAMLGELEHDTDRLARHGRPAPDVDSLRAELAMPSTASSRRQQSVRPREIAAEQRDNRLAVAVEHSEPLTRVPDQIGVVLWSVATPLRRRSQLDCAILPPAAPPNPGAFGQTLRTWRSGYARAIWS
jgi:hypothetical protein